MGNADAAETAGAIVEERLATESSARTGEPFAEYFHERRVETLPETPVVLIDLTLDGEVFRGDRIRMLSEDDFCFLAW